MTKDFRNTVLGGAVPPADPSAEGKTQALADIIRARTNGAIGTLLVVGCGDGLEAAVLARRLGARTVGVDLDASVFHPAAAAAADLRAGDATCLEFDDGTFDFVFSYHALEHIADYRKALTEMRRVLSRRGACCVGTPNRFRLVGYLGSKDAAWRDIVAWNAADWKARLRGRFRNEYGAHAGFSSGELRTALESVFESAQDISGAYYASVYARYAAWVRLMTKTRSGAFLFPSVYYLAAKGSVGAVA